LRFVAYVYAGWHADQYRPGVNEWSLLDGFRPYFDGHAAPARPAGGAYDDTDPRTSLRQMAMARANGVEAFAYFMYYHSRGFVMNAAMDVAFAVARSCPDGVSLLGTWCVRLPHDCFPVAKRDDLEVPTRPPPIFLSLDERLIESLTLRDLEDLIAADDPAWLSAVALGTAHR